jgi:misacylated tRNA(Ala) deacylase
MNNSVPLPPTLRLYLEDDHCLAAQACVMDVRGQRLAFDRSCFYPGGGGQPPDHGTVGLPDGVELRVVDVEADEAGVLWHAVDSPVPPTALGALATQTLDRERRLALSRFHTVLHVLNTIALRDYGGWITGVQIATDHSRIDFKLEGFSAALCAELETSVNRVLAAGHALRAYTVSEEEFLARDDLLRTLKARPPVVDGRVRVVEIAGFDAQACGGTHVPNTAQLGRFSIFRTENKGKINKRLYVRLT